MVRNRRREVYFAPESHRLSWFLDLEVIKDLFVTLWVENGCKKWVPYDQ